MEALESETKTFCCVIAPRRFILKVQTGTAVFGPAVSAANYKTLKNVSGRQTEGKCIWWYRILPSPRTITGHTPANIIRINEQLSDCSCSPARRGHIPPNTTH